MAFVELTARNFATQAGMLGLIWPAVMAAEMLWPRHHPSLRSRLQGAVFTLLYLVAASLVFAGVASMRDALHLRPLFTISLGAMPRPAMLLVAVLWTVAAAVIVDFFYYWTHRMQHGLFWRFHSVHHAIADLNVVNAYHHWTEELTRLPLMTIPLIFLMPDGLPTIPLISFLTIAHGHYVHSASTLNFGPLVRVFADNRIHRVHHSREERHVGKNFGVLTTIWDQVFGTAYFPAKGEWPRTGLADRAEASTLREYLIAAPRPATSPK